MKSTKKSFWMSVLAVVLCCTMLIGTTWAWFTDSVTSGRNKIAAGNLDIELEYTTDGTTWNTVDDATKLFSDESLWEPGHTEVAYLRLSNKGTLALKYNLGINVYTEKSGTNVAGESFKLSDYINMGVVENWNGTVYADRAAALAAVTTAGSIKTYTKADNMTAGAEAKPFAIVVYMPETVGNVANYKTGTEAPEIEMGVTVVATQLASEKDSFDENYDITAPWMGEVAESVPTQEGDANVYLVSNGAELAKIAAMVNGGDDLNGKTVKLVKDIDLAGIAWTPIGSSVHAFNGTFNGQDHTILNLKVYSDNYAGLFGNAFNHGTIQNVKVVNANVSGHNKVGVILGGGYADITNCDVDKATVTATTWKIDGKWDDGDKVGTIAGQIKESFAYTVKDCDVSNVTITGYRDVGGIAGYGYAENVFSNNTVTNAVIVNDRVNNYQNYTEDNQFDVGEIVGEYSGTIASSNKATNVTFKVIKAPVVVEKGETPKETQDNVNAAIIAATAGDTIILPNTDDQGSIELPNVGSGVTIKGDGTQINANKGKLPNINGATLDGLVLNCGQDNYNGFTHSDAVIKNCTIKGLLFSYNNGGEQVFENCTFINEKESGEYNMWAYGNVSYKNCTFKSFGKFVNVYNEGSTHFDVNFDGCKFINLKDTGNKAAVNVKDTSEGNKLNITVIINKCTTEGTFPAEKDTDTLKVFNSVVQLDDIKSGKSNIKIIQDGIPLWPKTA